MKSNIIAAITSIALIIALAMNTKAQTSEVNGPGTYKILKDDKGPIRIPFRMHNGKPLLDVEINGEKATLMIDNGLLWDPIWLFGSPLVKELELKPIEEGTIGGAGEGERTRAYSSSNLTVKFKDIIFYEQLSYVSPAEAGFANMFPGSDGQLSNTFFKHFIVEFDFITNEVILHNPKQFKYKSKGKWYFMCT